MNLFTKEDDIKMKEVVFSSLSSFLRFDNFAGKQEFISKMGGLEFLAAILQEKSNSNRLINKVLILIYDLALNDESIFESEPTYVR